jgi:hypothetical protein
VAVPGDVTKDAVTGKVAVVSPAGTVTDAGTVTTGLLLDKLTNAPSAPAGDARLRVPVPVSPAVSDDGEMVSPEIVDEPWGIMDSEAFVVAPAAVPVIVAVVGWLTGKVATVNSAVVWPCGTTAPRNTRAAGVFEANDTSVPPGGAGLVNVTTPVTGIPADGDAGAIVIERVLGAVPAGSITEVPVADDCGLEAFTWKPVDALALGATNAKVPLDWPCGMSTTPGSWRPLLLLSASVSGCAAEHESWTKPLTVIPLMAGEGSKEMEAGESQVPWYSRRTRLLLESAK